MKGNNATVMIIAILGIFHFSLETHLSRRVEFDIASCTNSPKFELEPEVAGRDVTAELNSTDQLIFYFAKPTSISMECYATFPIEIKLDREMPSLVEDVRMERIVDDIFDSSTYCYRIRYRLPEDYRITGKYTCKGIDNQNETSSIFIFSNGHDGPELLNSGSVKTVSGIPDDTGMITIPCIGTDPLQKPKVFGLPPFPYLNDFVEVTIPEVNYIPTRGFVINATQGRCCDQYRCSMPIPTNAPLTVHLQTFSRRLYIRVPDMKPGDKSRIELPGPQNINLYCESNEEIRLEYHSQHATTMNQHKPKSFYKYRFSLSGHLGAGELDVACVSKATGARLYSWRYSIRYDRGYTPGIEFSSANPEYPFSCRSIGTDVNTYNIQCDDYINCQIAERFSDLVNINVTWNKGYREIYPFSVTVGSKCPVKPHCAQIHDKTERKQGIIRCIESKPEERVYTQNYIKGLNGQIIIHHVNTTNEDEMLQMVNITRKIYYNETIEFQCEATTAIFAMGIQLVFTLQDGSLLTKNNLTHFTYEEEIRDGRITLKSPVVILDPNIRSVACHAPFWNTEGWKAVSQPLTVEMGECPSIAESDTELTWVLSDVNKTIQCEGSGDPTPTILWTRDNDHISSSENKHILKLTSENSSSITSWILFSRVEESHTGKYLCKAENVRGVALKLFNVKIKSDGDGITRDLIIYGSIFGTIIVLLGVLVVILVKRILKTRSALSTAEIKLFKLGNPDLLGQEGADVLGNIENMPYDQIYEIHRSRFTWQPTAILGKGAFGIVYKGKYLDRPIAIKTIQPPSVSRSTEVCVYTRALLSEIKVMCYLASPGINEHSGKMNIVSLIGANTKNIRKDVYLLCEFCELGSLEGYLYKHRQKFQPIFLYSNRPADTSISVRSSHSEAVISTAELTKWAYEIANGMAYVSSRNIMHGDLAARNVLLSSERVAKISDFGLSRRLYEYNTYTKQNQEPLPWRWMAIESLKHMKFSSRSDVWSFGITVWEIFSLAEVPYPGLTWTVDFVDALEQGMRPTRPKHASENIYKLMKQTWLENPDERQNFEQIRTEMRSIYEEYISQNYESLTPSDFA